MTIAAGTIRYDPIGGYWYEHGQCVRAAFARYLGDDHPLLDELPPSADPAAVVTFCERHRFRCFHGTWEAEICDGWPIVWLLDGAAGEGGHATFCCDPRRVLARGLSVVALVLLPGVLAMEPPVYPWFDAIPEELQARWRTRKQLAAEGLRPARGAQPVAEVRWRRGWAALFDREAAVPKRVASEAQRAAVARLAVKRRTCPGCGAVQEQALPADWTLWDCPTCARRQVAQDRAAASAAAAKALADRNAVVLDLETTSLGGYAVEIAVIDMQGAVLLDTRLWPEAPIEEEAVRVHGLTLERLAGAPTFAAIADELTELLRGRRVWTYNSDFDRAVLEREIERLALRRAEAGLLHHLPIEAHRFARRAARSWGRRIRWRCAMKRYAQFVGEWSERHDDYRFQPLPGGDHRALGDARAALAVLRRMAAAGEQSAGAGAGEGSTACST
jgi:DNA polymerase III epsilon subunit-like protein